MSLRTSLPVVDHATKQPQSSEDLGREAVKEEKEDQLPTSEDMAGGGCLLSRSTSIRSHF